VNRATLLLALTLSGTVRADDEPLEDSATIQARILDNLHGIIQCSDRIIGRAIRDRDVRKLPRAVAGRIVNTVSYGEYWLFRSLHAMRSTWDWFY